MNFSTGLSALSLTIIMSSVAANAMDLNDARQYAAKLLKEYGPVPVTVTVRKEACFPGCQFVSRSRPIVPVSYTPFGFSNSSPKRRSPLIRLACPAGHTPIQFCHSYDTTFTEHRILKFGQIHLTFPDQIKFGKPIFHKLPDEIYMDAAIVQNCSLKNKTGSVAKTLMLSVTATSSTTITKGISNTLGFNLRLNYGSPQFGSINGGVNYSETITQSTAHTQGVAKTFADSTTQIIAYPEPKSAVMAEFKVYKLTSELPFKVDAVIDAPLETNQKGLKSLSAIASKSKRTIPLEGYITLVGFSKAAAGVADVKYDESLCPDAGPDGIVARNGFSSEVLNAPRREKHPMTQFDLKPVEK